MLIGSLLLITTLIVPFASAIEDYKEYLQENPDGIYLEELDMTNEEAIHISLFEFGKIYTKIAELDISRNSRVNSIITLVLIIAFAIFAILTTLFSALKKPIAAILFNLFSLILFRLIVVDFDDKGVILRNGYGWGIAQYFCYIGVSVVFLGAICMLITKINLKKKLKIKSEFVSQ